MSRIASLVAAAHDLEAESVPVPGWGVTLDIRGMDGHGRARYLKRLVDARNSAEEDDDITALARLEAEILVECAFDPEDGSAAFTLDDIDMLLGKSGGIIGWLSRLAIKASGLDADAEERLGKPSSVSTETPSDVSTSASPANLE